MTDQSMEQPQAASFTNKQRPRFVEQPMPDTIPPTPSENTVQILQDPIDTRALAYQVPIIGQDPETILIDPREAFFRPGDQPTLAGRLVRRVYNWLLERPAKPDLSQIALIKRNEEPTHELFQSYSQQQIEKLSAMGIPTVFSKARMTGQNNFHMNNTPDYLIDRPFHFTTAQPPSDELRWYVSLRMETRYKIPEYFVDACVALMKGGIESFSAKSTGFKGTTLLDNNMIFYIPRIKHEQAQTLLTQFLTERQIGMGCVKATVPTGCPGLSWAHDPDEVGLRIWGEITGSSQQTSHHSLVAALMMPDYFDRLAKDQQLIGKLGIATQYQTESQRIRKILQAETR